LYILFKILERKSQACVYTPFLFNVTAKAAFKVCINQAVFAQLSCAADLCFVPGIAKVDACSTFRLVHCTEGSVKVSAEFMCCCQLYKVACIIQLLTQAVGRAGRGGLPGEAVIQTYQPDHYAITCAAAQDYESFYQEEILYRELSGYPPVAHMLAVQIYGKEEENVKQLALRLTDVVKSNMDFLSGKQKEQSNKKIQVLGPAPANISKINDIYRYVFYVKHAEYDVLVEVKDRLEETLRQWQPRQMSIQFDFDPVSVL
jgi:primosomal protein N'